MKTALRPGVPTFVLEGGIPRTSSAGDLSLNRRVANLSASDIPPATESRCPATG